MTTRRESRTSEASLWNSTELTVPARRNPRTKVPSAFSSILPELPPAAHAQVIQLRLPGWNDYERGTPNPIIRSALFAAVQGKSRRYLDQEQIFSSRDITVKYTGQQLTQSDLDVWETLVHLARNQPLGKTCEFSAHSLLKALGRHTGKSQHTWLHGTIVRLVACAVEITHRHLTYGGALLFSFKKHEDTGAYLIRLNPDLIKLFSDNTWTKLDWEQRKKLIKKPLAQALHAYYSSHAKPFPVKVESLRRLTASNIKQLRHFRETLRAALAELANPEVGFLASFRVDESDLVHVERSPNNVALRAP